MITEDQLAQARKQRDDAQDIINQYGREKADAFEKRMRENPVFSDEELTYSRTTLCPCGHGLAYPKDCTPWHYWDCSAILRGIADSNVQHTGQLPFSFYNVKAELGEQTTRGIFNPKQEQKGTP